MSSETEKLIDQMAKKIVEALQKSPESEWGLASAPFTSKEQKEIQQVIKPSLEQNQKELVGFKTHTFLDSMFINGEEKSINGVPFGSSNLLSGLPNSGKSLLLEEIALQVAHGNKKVVYVTSEEIFKADTPRYDLESRMRERTKTLGLNWDMIAKNLFVLDMVTHAEMREWWSFVSTFRLLAEKEQIELLLIDSLTMCEDSRGQIKYRLGELVKYCQIHGITSIMVNQRATDDPDSLSLAGGLALSHVADIVMILDYKKLSSWDGNIKQDTNAKQGEIVYFFRILKNRMSKFRANYFAYSITKDGLIRLIENKPVEEKEGLH